MKLKKRGLKIVALVTVIVFSILFLTLLISFFSVYFSVKLDADAVMTERAKIKIFADNDEEIECETLNRYVMYEDINTNIINAFVALEDKRFFKHKGVDYYRTLGALVSNIKSGYFKEGGSTITQQLAKNTHLTNEKSINRKIKEMKLAKDIEKKYSKEEIMEMYLNAIYYGNGIYGIDSACKKYFGKSPAEVNLAESAILAGIVKSPQKYSPQNYPEKSYQRMKLVLDLMKEQGYINENEYDIAKNYKYNDKVKSERSPYISAIITEACEILNVTELELLKSPIQIYTYYDKNLQNNVKNKYESGNYDLLTQSKDNALSYTMIADNETGGIASYYDNGDVSINMRRQPGSVIKPILVYCPALNSRAITPADVFIDEKKNFNGYSPSNYRDIYYGQVDVETALKKSINSVAVEIYNKTGAEYCKDLAKKSGLTFDKNDNNLALSLGGMTYGLTSEEIISSYMTLANGGIKKNVGFIKEIVDDDGRTLYRKNDTFERVFSEEASFLTTDMLVKTAIYGTAKKLGKIGYPIAAKTGTVEGISGNNTDAWCVSYTQKYTSCVWYGGKDNTDDQSINMTGGGLPALLTADIFAEITHEGNTFIKPKSIVALDIDILAKDKDQKIYLANINTPEKYKKTYYFDINNKPERYSPYYIIDNNDLIATKTDEGILIDFKVNYPYSYRIYHIDNGTERDIYRYQTTIEDLFYDRKYFVSSENTIKSIYMDVYYYDELIGIGVMEDLNIRY